MTNPAHPPQTSQDTPQSQAPYWKHVVLSVLGVYPLLMIVLPLTGPLMPYLPKPIGILTVAIIVSCLMTWPVMPLLGRLLGPWMAAK